MKEKLMEILCCPMCKGDLDLKITKKEGNEIINGTLTCHKCDFPYPIDDGIPNLLPPEQQKAAAKNIKK